MQKKITFLNISSFEALVRKAVYEYLKLNAKCFLETALGWREMKVEQTYH